MHACMQHMPVYECLQMLVALGCVSVHHHQPFARLYLGQERLAHKLRRNSLTRHRRGLRQHEKKEVKERQKGRDAVCLYAEEEATVVR